MTIQTEKIYLGSKSATEPLLLGDTTAELLKEMIAIEYDNINQADKNKLFNHRARSRREGKPVIS